MRLFGQAALADLLKTALFTFGGAALILSFSPRRAEWALAGNALGAGAAILVGGAALARAAGAARGGGDMESAPAFFARLLRFSSAYVANSCMVAALLFASQWMVNAFGSLAETGLFGMAAQIAQMMLIGVTIFCMVLSPYLSGMWVEGREEQARAVLRLAIKGAMMILFAASVAAWAAMALILPRWMPEFAGSVPLLPLLLAAQVCNGSIWTAGMYANLVERPWLKLWAAAASLASLCAAGFSWAPQFGPMGAAWAFFAANAMGLAVTLAYTRRLGLALGRFAPMAIALPAAMAVPGLWAWAACAAALAAFAFPHLVFDQAERRMLAETAKRLAILWREKRLGSK
ncbi:MAG: hypothetical protein BWZ10_02728 [candidate division BRC1 bacterium ADurb.BinA364]|nr:MAG: hypothetical protein BWZ10_02728 [candidate division BRC1 bacterium ADurb.BinA364]